MERGTQGILVIPTVLEKKHNNEGSIGLPDAVMLRRKMPFGQ
jgi:hypothetical protein